MARASQGTLLGDSLILQSCRISWNSTAVHKVLVHHLLPCKHVETQLILCCQHHQTMKPICRKQHDNQQCAAAAAATAATLSTRLYLPLLSHSLKPPCKTWIFWYPLLANSYAAINDLQCITSYLDSIHMLTLLSCILGAAHHKDVNIHLLV